MQIHHASKSDVGMKRDNNEDNLLVFPEQNVFAVFDGMGGHAAGEVASSIAANEVREFFDFTGKDEDATWPFKGDREKTYDVMVHFVERTGAGPRALVAHVGDSRVYLFRQGQLQRITIDHSLVEEYLRMGKITAEEAKNFPQKNIILRALGQQKQVDVEINVYQPQAGDIFLLCSDGLSGMISDEMMQAIVAKNASDLEAATKKLIDAANANGGVDNVTVILAQFAG
jgi:protein phosphatase